MSMKRITWTELALKGITFKAEFSHKEGQIETVHKISLPKIRKTDQILDCQSSKALESGPPWILYNVKFQKSNAES
uniref:Uncharacterized protein n=1 Tax=Nelumbo nucifera TaxID=4432 RepID=A0A822YP80_NELNU|nr:TPA_asm: hypothetical protein HUJ06_004967 [Nelumbo nucifera]